MTTPILVKDLKKVPSGYRLVETRDGILAIPPGGVEMDQEEPGDDRATPS